VELDIFYWLEEGALMQVVFIFLSGKKTFRFLDKASK
jgi:hypothetical protein